MRWARSAFIAPATAFVLFLVAAPAQSGTITIEYDLTGSGVALLGGILNIPPDGSITSATARVTVPGSDLTSAAAGDARLTNLELTATIDGTVGGSVLITGGFEASQTGGGDGSLALDLTTLDIVSLALDLTGTLDCLGGQCLSLGDFPASVTDSPLDLSGFDPFTLGGLGTFGAGTLSGVLAFDLSGNDVVVGLTGQEVSRNFVPEPASGTLVGLSLAAILCVSPRRRVA
jgi:hypothetical protein